MYMYEVIQIVPSTGKVIERKVYSEKLYSKEDFEFCVKSAYVELKEQGLEFHIGSHETLTSVIDCLVRNYGFKTCENTLLSCNLSSFQY